MGVSCRYRDRVGVSCRYRDRVGVSCRYRDRVGVSCRYRDRVGVSCRYTSFAQILMIVEDSLVRNCNQIRILIQQGGFNPLPHFAGWYEYNGLNSTLKIRPPYSKMINGIFRVETVVESWEVN